MSERSDLEDSEAESSNSIEDLEVQLYSLVHYGMDSVDAVATEGTSTETNKNHNQQDSVKEDQVCSTLSAQHFSGVNAKSDHQSATDQNELLGADKHKSEKKRCKKPEKVIDYLALLKEYKNAKAQQNFAEMSRNASLMWFHKQQNLTRGYRKRYWMKETSDQSDNLAISCNLGAPFHVFHNSSNFDNRNEKITNRKSTPENAEAFVTQQFSSYTAFQDPGVTEYDESSAAIKSRNSLDTMSNNINHNTNNYESSFKKKKRKKHKEYMGNDNTDVSSRAEITKNKKSSKAQQKEVQESHITNHAFDKNIKNDDIDSRYSIAPSRKEADDIIVLDSSDSESSVIMLGSPPPKPAPVVCLDGDDKNLEDQQKTAAAQQLILNVAAPKQLSIEKIQSNNKMTEAYPTEAVASSSRSQATPRAKGHRNVNNCQKWTAEMINYYNESWGGEHFDVISLQHQMSNNPVKWRVSKQDFQMGFNQRRHRDKCTACNQFGHLKWFCREPPRPICCKMCGERGHTEPRCPFPICLQCGERTMIYVRSCRKCKSKAFCTVCNKSGHSHETCPEIWRRYCTTTSTLQVHKARGPVYKPKEQQWCCVCAKKGHFPEECQRFYVEPISFKVNNEIHTPKTKNKQKKKYYSEFRRRKIYFGMPC